MKNKKRYIGASVFLLGVILSGVWYDLKLAAIICLIILGSHLME